MFVNNWIKAVFKIMAGIVKNLAPVIFTRNPDSTQAKSYFPEVFNKLVREVFRPNLAFRIPCLKYAFFSGYFARIILPTLLNLGMYPLYLVCLCIFAFQGHIAQHVCHFR